MVVYNSSLRGRVLHLVDSTFLPAARRIRKWFASLNAVNDTAQHSVTSVAKQEKNA
jgi:hypothetical protein